MDAGLYEYLLTLSLGGVLWWFKRYVDISDTRLDGTNARLTSVADAINTLAERQELVRHQEETRARFEVVERDIKNLGDRVNESIRRETAEIRQEIHRHAESSQLRLDNNASQMNERLDKLIVLMMEMRNK